MIITEEKNVLENFTHTQLLQLANSGLGFTVDAKRFTHTQLLQLSNAASSSSAQITILNHSNFTHTQLLQLGNAGGGNIILA